MQLNLVKTGDGSYTLHREDIDEHYHSIHGARTESEHVFIRNGLHHILPDTSKLNILEIGLGTCYNALLTALSTHHRNVIYTGVEKFPLPQVLFQDLIQKDPFIHQNRELYTSISQANWGDRQFISESFELYKIEADVFTWIPEQKFDLIYFDAFGFRAQEEMWSELMYKKLLDASNPGAVLVTYAAKGVVRRGMQSAGWNMQRLPGPPGKREMLRGVKE